MTSPAAADRRSSRVGILTAIAIVWASLIAAVLTWQAYAYRGLFAYIAEWQFHNFDQMFPITTIVVIVFVLSLPLLLLIAWQMRRRKKLYGRVSAAELIVRDTRTARILLVLAAVAAIFAAGLALYGLSLGAFADKPIVALQLDGKAPTSQTAVRINGWAIQNRVGHYREHFIFSSRDLYVVPLVSKRGDTKIRYFVEVRGIKTAPVQHRTISGILITDALPGGLAQLYENSGYRLDEPVYVIFADRASARWPWMSAAADLAIMALLLMVAHLLLLRHVRQIAPTAKTEMSSS